MNVRKAKSALTILEVTEEKVPSVIGMDRESNIVIGKAARDMGLSGHTNTYHFKTKLGSPQDDSQPGLVRDYWVFNDETEQTKLFTPVEATREFLGQLIPSTGNRPQRLIIGVPVLEGSWKENYRKNIRQVLEDLGFDDPWFYPEPYAVYQYYKHVEKKIADTNDQQTILVIDFGGGTFDCCVIRTTQTGQLARSGLGYAQPLGVQSSAVAGEAVDIGLLRIARKRSGRRFRDDPVDRALKHAQSLWAVENTKIKLSEAVNRLPLNNVSTTKGLEELTEDLHLAGGSFHMSDDIDVSLNGEDLRNVVESLWKREWGKVLLNCHRESKKKKGGEDIEKYDVVLLAGGSAHLPFLPNLIRKTLPNELVDAEVVVGGHLGAAVAKGIAVECKIQADKQPELINDRLVPYLLSDLYIRLGRTKIEKESPKIRDSDLVIDNIDGLVYSSPDELGSSTITCQLEHRYKPRGVLHYWFYGVKAADEVALNHVSTQVRIPFDKYADKKIGLTLKIDADGTITPEFIFKRLGKNSQKVKGQPFNLGSERGEGREYLGVDFGTSNSYIAKFIVPEKRVDQTVYPEYEYSREMEISLYMLEKEIEELREDGILEDKALKEHALKNQYDFVFHSNKIEGNRLSRGQTEDSLKVGRLKELSKDQCEAHNLRDAYIWLLDNYKGSISQLPGFVRELNRRLLKDIDDSDGAFRTRDVTISGVSYQPPPPGSLDSFVSKLGTEVREARERGRASGLELAVRAHTKLAAIHPFIDGNGRTARLLMVAILLDHGLPVVVLNSDDKERYLDALRLSNKGKLDSLLQLFSGLMREALEKLSEISSTSSTISDVKIPETPGHENDVESVGSSDIVDDQRKSRSKQPQRQINPPETLSSKNVAPGVTDSRGALTRALKRKAKQRKEMQAAEYPAWRAAFEMFRSELKSKATTIHEMEEFREAGYTLTFREFDIVNEGRFEAFWTRQDLTHTWFCSIDINNSFELESESNGLMFQFGPRTEALRKLSREAAPVSCSLAISVQDSGIWLPLCDEPIRLREVGYASGELVYVDFDGSKIEEGLDDTFYGLVSSIIGGD